MSNPFDQFDHLQANPFDQFDELEEISKIEGITRAAGQGLTFGFGDEIAAGAQAGWDWLANDKDFSDSYSDHLKDERAQLEQFRNDNPALAYGSEIAAGLIVPGGAVKTAAKGATQLARSVKGATAAGTTGGVYGFGAGEGGFENRAKNAATTGAISAVVGGAAPTIVSKAKPALQKLMQNKLKKQMVKTAPTNEQLKAQSKALFDKADEVIDLDRSVLTDSAQSIINKAEKEGMDKILNPSAHRAAERIMEEATSPTPTIGFGTLNTLRKQAQMAAKSSEKADSALGSQLVDDVDDVIARMSPEMGSDVAEARKMWGQLRRSEMMDEAFDKAGRQASGFENGLRTQFRSILNNPKKRRGFSADEIKAMDDFVKGSFGSNVLKKVGKLGVGLDQQSNSLMSLMGAGAGGLTLGPAGMALSPIIGTAAQKLSERATQKQANYARALTASGGKTPQAKLTAMQQLMLENMIRRSSGGVEGTSYVYK